MVFNEMAMNYKRDWTNDFNQRLADTYFQYHDPYSHKYIYNKYYIVNTPQGDVVEECRTVNVYSFYINDSDDPDLMAAEPLYNWEKSEQGQWIMKQAAEPPTWHRMADPMTMGHKYLITAKLTGPVLTQWLLKYGEKCPVQSR
jgi:hypothetical protein